MLMDSTLLSGSVIYELNRLKSTFKHVELQKYWLWFGLSEPDIGGDLIVLLCSFFPVS